MLAANAAGPAFAVNSFAAGDRTASAVAMDAGRDDVAAWQSVALDGDESGNTNVYGQRYDGLGRTVGGESRVNTTTGMNRSLIDGQYMLTIAGAGVTGDDLSLDGTPGGDKTFAAHRLFEDGDGDVGLQDLSACSTVTFGVQGQPGSIVNPAFDSDKDGDVDLLDLNRFVQRLFTSGYTPDRPCDTV